MKLAWVLMIAACGGGGGGGGGGDDDDVAPDSPASKPTNAGSITVQGFNSSNGAGGTASASFTQGDGADCPVTTVGACDVTQACASAPAQQVSAGQIDVTGAAVPISLVPTTAGTYPMLSDYQGPAPWLVGGDALSVTAAGATVPGFHATLTAPSKQTITVPATTTTVQVNRASGFTVGWTGGGSGKLQVYLSSGSTTLLCRFDVGAGTGTIPASTLAMLPAGSGAYAMASISQTEVDAGDWAVQVIGFYNAAWATGGVTVSGPASFQ